MAAQYTVKSNASYDGTKCPHPDVSTGSGVDIALAIGFLMLASVAVTQSPHIALTLLAVGFGGHAIVDLIHGANVLPADSLPDWYATACAIYDVVMAGVCYLPIVRRA